MATTIAITIAARQTQQETQMIILCPSNQLKQAHRRLFFYLSFLCSKFYYPQRFASYASCNNISNIVCTEPESGSITGLRCGLQLCCIFAFVTTIKRLYQRLSTMLSSNIEVLMQLVQRQHSYGMLAELSICWQCQY